MGEVEWPKDAHLFQSHSVLDKQGYARVEVAHIFLEHKVLL